VIEYRKFVISEHSNYLNSGHSVLGSGSSRNLDGCQINIYTSKHKIEFALQLLECRVGITIGVLAIVWRVHSDNFSEVTSLTDRDET
jgi:hypothetical protein